MVKFLLNSRCIACKITVRYSICMKYMTLIYYCAIIYISITVSNHRIPHVPAQPWEQEKQWKGVEYKVSIHIPENLSEDAQAQELNHRLMGDTLVRRSPRPGGD